jgi:hypothetical protein
MALLFLVEPCYALDRHIVRFGGPGREDHILRVCTDQVCNILIKGEQSVKEIKIEGYPEFTPFWHPQQLVQLPSHKHGCDCVDYHIDP